MGTTKEELIATLLSLNDFYPWQMQKGRDCDLIITFSLAEGRWLLGSYKKTYNARILAKQEEQTVYFREVVKEAGSGLYFAALFEKKKVIGKELSGSVHETRKGPGGAAVHQKFRYEQIREIIKKLVQERGWEFSTVLSKSKVTAK